MELGSYRPVFSQVIDYLVIDILDGTYAVGDALPDVNAMSMTLQVNPVAVERAYQELEQLGVIDHRGEAMLVTSSANEILRERERERFMRADLPVLRRRLELLGIDPSKIDWSNDGD